MKVRARYYERLGKYMQFSARFGPTMGLKE